MTRRQRDVLGFEPSPLELGRRAYRRHRALRSLLIAVGSTLIFATAGYLTLVSAPGWARVRAFYFDPEVAVDVLPKILDGLWLNIRVLAVAAVCVAVLGLLLAIMRTLQGPVFFPLRLLATLYTAVFRGIPLLVLLYLIGFGLPGLRFDWMPTGATVLGTLAIVLCYSAYVAEVFRAGIEAVHPSQRAAARSLGLTHRQTMRLVVVPQGARKVIPPLLNDFVAMQKDVGLISVLGAVDAIRSAQIAAAPIFNFTRYVVAALLFVLLAVPSALLADWASDRARKREQAGGLV